MGYGGNVPRTLANELANLMGYGRTLGGDHFRLLDMSANSQFNILYAEMSEWSIVQSWNGCVQRCTPGSNPGLCAKFLYFVLFVKYLIQNIVLNRSNFDLFLFFVYL